MSFSFKRFLPHLLVIAGFIVISLAYFSPVLEGKKIFQSDIMHYIGMSKQQKDFEAETGEVTYWTNSGFGGMPTYLLGAKYPHNYIKKFDLMIRFLPRPANYLFLYFIGFYILLLTLKVDFKLAALGAIAFGFSSYFIIILGAGHNSKAHAIALMPLVLSGIILTFRKKYIGGFLLTILAMGLQMLANHFQMTYYLMFLVVILGIAYLIDAYKKKELPHFFKSVGILTVAVIISIGLNATHIMATQEYVKESTRGQGELTINPDGSPKELTGGLSRDYITEYSYGVMESFNLFIPKFMGGGTVEDVGRDSNTYQAFINLGATPIQALNESREAPMYWGEQTIVEGPAYVGAVVIFLFVLSLFLLKGRHKWWLVGGILMSLLLSFGRHLPVLTNFFIDYVPLYSRFRAVSSIQVILELCIPVISVFALVKLFDQNLKKEEKLKALKYTVGITGGLALLFLLIGTSLFDFVGFRDGQYRQVYGQAVVDAFIEDRKSLFTTDTIRTLILVVLSAIVVYFFIKEKLSKNLTVMAFLVLIAFDLITVNRAYVNNESFIPASRVDVPHQPNEADLEIFKDKSHFRVFDMSSATQPAPARPAYFHNSLSGYHAAKLRRFDEIMDYHVYRNNFEALNMLNTKYVIADDDKGGFFAYENTDANGNAWFIKELRQLQTANEEIMAIDSLNTKIEAVTTMLDFDNDPRVQEFTVDSLVSITLDVAKPNYLKYTSNNTYDGFAIFSETYYGQGWDAYLDGELAPHIRVNYLLRGMHIPKGQHSIEFRFQPKVIEKGSKIALGSSILYALLCIGGLFYEFKKSRVKPSS
ncbi:MAG: hypothetical protein AAF901_05240 [Bacteroidota bacterium]